MSRSEPEDRADNDELEPKHVPRNRSSSATKLRRSRKNCPVCLAPLEKNARRTKLQARCVHCRANISPGKHCSKCGAEAIWENKTSAACRSCGIHGGKKDVVAGA